MPHTCASSASRWLRQRIKAARCDGHGTERCRCIDRRADGVSGLRGRSERVWLGPFEESGLPGGNRTPDNRLRRPVLYPTELRADGQRAHCCEPSPLTGTVAVPVAAILTAFALPPTRSAAITHLGQWPCAPAPRRAAARPARTARVTSASVSMITVVCPGPMVTCRCPSSEMIVDPTNAGQPQHHGAVIGLFPDRS